jgi:hypothetical protein
MSRFNKDIGSAQNAHKSNPDHKLRGAYKTSRGKTGAKYSAIDDIYRLLNS